MIYFNDLRQDNFIPTFSEQVQIYKRLNKSIYKSYGKGIIEKSTLQISKYT